MSTTPIEIACRLDIIRGWMDVAKFAALKAAMDAKIARTA